MKAPKRINDRFYSKTEETISPLIKLLKHRPFLRGSTEWLGIAFITLAVVSFESSVTQALSVIPYAVTAKFIWIRANSYFWGEKNSSDKK